MLCVSILCVSMLCVSMFCVSMLCVSMLCVSMLCVSMLCVSMLCVCMCIDLRWKAFLQVHTSSWLPIHSGKYLWYVHSVYVSMHFIAKCCYASIPLKLVWFHCPLPPSPLRILWRWQWSMHHSLSHLVSMFWDMMSRCVGLTSMERCWCLLCVCVCAGACCICAGVEKPCSLAGFCA